MEKEKWNEVRRLEKCFCNTEGQENHVVKVTTLSFRIVSRDFNGRSALVECETYLSTDTIHKMKEENDIITSTIVLLKNRK